MKNKTLIYIIGAGRSGTTILDILLGNNNDTISLGEINRYYKRNGIPPKRKEKEEVYVFWNRINSKLNQSNLSFNYLDDLFHRNEYHTKFFKSLFKFNEKEYRDILKSQYTILEKETKENVLIESSKYPVRALNLSNYLTTNQNIKFIFLKKDPVKVVNSFQKKGLEQPPKFFLIANFYYLFINILCISVIRILKKRKHRITIVKYEELLTKKEETIKKISKDLDLDLSSLEEKIANKETLKTGYLFDGNRIRLKKTLTLSPPNNIKIKNSKYYFTRMFNYIVYR